MRKNIGQKFLAVWMLFLFVMIFMASDAFAAYSVRQINARFSAVAAEPLVTGNVVMLKDADGKTYKADANDAALRPAIGIIGKGGTTGQTVEIVTIGIFSGWTGLAEGSPGFLSETPAAITQSAPAYSQQVGQAISTTSYFVNFQNYFDSSALTVLGTLSGATPLVFDGSTAGTSATTVAVTDPTGTNTVTLPDASFTISGIRYYNAGTTSASANTAKSTAGLFYSGSVAVSSGTNVVVSGFSPAFTSTATYNCIVSPQAPTPLTGVAWKCAKTSTASVTISTSTTGAVSDTIDYFLSGY